MCIMHYRQLSLSPISNPKSMLFSGSVYHKHCILGQLYPIRINAPFAVTKSNGLNCENIASFMFIELAMPVNSLFCYKYHTA